MADGNTGVIACKLPNGLVVEHKGKTVLLNGSDHESAVSGYGMTPDVGLDWFQDWATGDARDFPPVARGLIFVAPNARFAQDQAREQGDDVRSGLEGVDPENPGAGDAEFVGRIEPTDEQRRETAKARAGADKPK